MKYKLTSSPWGFRFWDFPRYCRFMKEIGISDICLMFNDPNDFPLAIKKEEKAIKEAKRISEDIGVRFLEISYAGEREKEIELATQLGVKYYRVCTIWEESEEQLGKTIDMLREIGELAGREGLEVVVENHGGLMRTGRMCRKLLEEIALPNVKLNYDPANFLYYGEDPVSALDDILPFIGFTHFKSVKYQQGKPLYCRLREGVIDYGKIFDKLLPVYDGYIGLEYEEPSDVAEGTIDDLNYLRNLLNF
ncbi:MAG: sugar phosphate isomerase/epimerase family protein [bacterium]